MTHMILKSILALIIFNSSILTAEPYTDRAFSVICKNAMQAPQAPLIPISLENTELVRNAGKIKVALWMSPKHLANVDFSVARLNRDSWVTVAPQVQTFCRDFVAKADLAGSSSCLMRATLRVNQFLGLRPQSYSRKILMSFFVDPEAIIRPCIDPDPSNDSCSRSFNTKKVNSLTPNMASFINERFSDGPGGNLDPSGCFPFTGMGYTYDWGSDTTFVGASEFIIPAHTPIFDVQFTPVEEMCRCIHLQVLT